MKKMFQVTSRNNETIVIVRVKGERKEARRDYKNLTRATMLRLDMLAYKSEYRLSIVISRRCVDVFIQERING